MVVNDDSISNQPAVPIDSDSEESLSGDDRDENPEISEIAVQNVIIEDAPREQSPSALESDAGNFPDSSSDALEVSISNHTSPLLKPESFKILPSHTHHIDESKSLTADIEDKSLAALSTLRKLKIKKVTTLPILLIRF